MAEKVRGRPVPYLRQWRMHQVLNQSELAQAAGMGRSSIIRAENGGVVSFANIRKLAAALQIDVQRLLYTNPEAPSGFV